MTPSSAIEHRFRFAWSVCPACNLPNFPLKRDLSYEEDNQHIVLLHHCTRCETRWRIDYTRTYALGCSKGVEAEIVALGVQAYADSIIVPVANVSDQENEGVGLKDL